MLTFVYSGLSCMPTQTEETGRVFRVKSSYNIAFCQTLKYHHFYFIMGRKVKTFCVPATSLSCPTSQLNGNILLFLRNASKIKRGILNLLGPVSKTLNCFMLTMHIEPN